MIDNDLNVRFVSLLTKNTYALVLAGGRGSRLKNLTDWRAKPAVPFGGKFRIVDFPLSNCVNSGIRRIGVATQYKSHSLIRHIQRGWSFLDGRFQEFVDILELMGLVVDLRVAEPSRLRSSQWLAARLMTKFRTGERP
jgi:hypothetical protein